MELVLFGWFIGWFIGWLIGIFYTQYIKKL